MENLSAGLAVLPVSDPALLARIWIQPWSSNMWEHRLPTHTAKDGKLNASYLKGMTSTLWLADLQRWRSSKFISHSGSSTANAQGFFFFSFFSKEFEYWTVVQSEAEKLFYKNRLWPTSVTKHSIKYSKVLESHCFFFLFREKKMRLIFSFADWWNISLNIPVWVQNVVLLSMMRDPCGEVEGVALLTCFRSLKTYLAARRFVYLRAFPWILIVWSPLSVTATLILKGK